MLDRIDQHSEPDFLLLVPELITLRADICAFHNETKVLLFARLCQPEINLVIQPLSRFIDEFDSEIVSSS